MTPLPARTGESLDGAGIVAPIKAHACRALHVVSRNRSHHAIANQRLMQRGAERC